MVLATEVRDGNKTKDERKGSGVLCRSERATKPKMKGRTRTCNLLFQVSSLLGPGSCYGCVLPEVPSVNRHRLALGAQDGDMGVATGAILCGGLDSRPLLGISSGATSSRSGCLSRASPMTCGVFSQFGHQVFESHTVEAHDMKQVVNILRWHFVVRMCIYIYVCAGLGAFLCLSIAPE